MASSLKKATIVRFFPSWIQSVDDTCSGFPETLESIAFQECSNFIPARYPNNHSTQAPNIRYLEIAASYDSRDYPAFHGIATLFPNILKLKIVGRKTMSYYAAYNHDRKWDFRLWKFWNMDVKSVKTGKGSQ
jgi:hypothetical protein